MKNLKHKNIEVNPYQFCKMRMLSLMVITLIMNTSCKKNIDQGKERTAQPEKTIIMKEKWHWGNADKQSESAGYAQVVKVGNTIYISGVPSNDLSPEGIKRLYGTLDECLKAFGATFEDVVKETLYTTDIETMKKHNHARKEFYNGDYPAATWVQISRLYEPTAKLEVDLIAEITGEE